MARLKVNPLELRRLIWAKKMTLKEAEAFSGVSSNTLARLLDNKGDVNLETARKLHEAFGLEFDKKGSDSMTQDLTLPSKQIFKLCKATDAKSRNTEIRSTIAQMEADGYILTDVIQDDGDCLLKFERKEA